MEDYKALYEDARNKAAKLEHENAHLCDKLRYEGEMEQEIKTLRCRLEDLKNQPYRIVSRREAIDIALGDVNAFRVDTDDGTVELVDNILVGELCENDYTFYVAENEV